MTTTSHLSDRMPAVAAGREAWSDQDRAHLAACADCRAEWLVVEVGAGLGAGVAADLDIEAIARVVVADRGRRAPLRTGGLVRRMGWVAATAAAAALLILVARPAPSGDPSPVASTVLLPELEGLSADELELVFDVLPTATGWNAPGAGLGDLTDEELERVLSTLEG